MVGLTRGNECAFMEASMTTRWAYRECCGGKMVSHGLFRRGYRAGMCRDALSEGWSVQLCWGKSFISYI